MTREEVRVAAIVGVTVATIPAASWYATASSDQNFTEGLFAAADWMERHSGAISAFATVVIMMFTVTLYWSTRQMAIAAQETIRQGHESEERQFRAYVLVDETNALFRLGETGVFNVVVRNFGRTPAYDLTVRVRAEQRELPLGTEALQSAEAVPVGSRGVLGPNCTTVAAATSKTPIDQSTCRAIAEDKAVIFVVGIIEYVDTFGKRQRSDFRLAWTGHQLRHGGGHLQVCPEGNTAT